MTILSKIARGASAGAIAGLLAVSSPALAGENPQVAAEVMALARAQWASEIAGQTPAQQLVAVADDYTEFNADYPTLLVGKDVASSKPTYPSAVGIPAARTRAHELCDGAIAATEIVLGPSGAHLLR